MVVGASDHWAQVKIERSRWCRNVTSPSARKCA